MTYNAKVEAVLMPSRIKALPVSPEGWPVPWFAAQTAPGVYDIRIADAGKVRRAVQNRQCWICGGVLGRYQAFVIGSMCVVNRLSAEPPSHRDCARFACQVCPFMTTPKMVRNEKDLPDGTVEPGGVMLRRNPGVNAIWITDSYELAGSMSQGILFRLGEPGELEWWCQGRKATRQEIDASISSGLPALREQCDREESDLIRKAAHAALDREVLRASLLLPQ